MAKMQTISLEQLIRTEERLPLRESIRLFRELLNLIDERHEAGELFLGLNPDNIRLVPTDGEYCLSAQMSGGLSEPQQESVGFRAPETALRDLSRIGKQSDYYSAAAVFYYCLTGIRLTNLQMFRAEPPSISAVAADLGGDAVKVLRRILRKGLAYSLQRRYHTSDEVRSDLTELEKYVR